MGNSARFALTIGAAALFAGCGGSQVPIDGPITTQQTGSGTPVYQSKAQPLVSKDELLYVTDPNANLVYMVSLPSGKLVGKLTGFNQPLTDCSDAAGNVYITDSQDGQVRAYKHGAKSAFRVLSVTGYIPTGCSADPTTGDLAVASCCGSPNGSLAVFKNARGSPKYYSNEEYEGYWFCTYDDRGNLFANAIRSGSSTFHVIELPKNKQRLFSITLRPSLSTTEAPSLAWDGSALAIANDSPSAIYQYAIKGTHGVRTHTTKILGGKPFDMFYILASGKTRTLYATIIDNSVVSVGVYKYPKGGKPLQHLYDAVDPLGVTVSIQTP
jgi:hypothetical protein